MSTQAERDAASYGRAESGSDAAEFGKSGPRVRSRAGGRTAGGGAYPAVEGRPRTGARRTLTATIAQLPNYLRLLWGLMTDIRVPRPEKLLVFGAIAYILMPLDWIPDFIPFFGEIDDVFLLVLSLQRLVQSAGRRVLLEHWAGDPDELDDLNMHRVLAAAAFFLPRRVRRRLRAIGRL